MSLASDTIDGLRQVYGMLSNSVYAGTLKWIEDAIWLIDNQREIIAAKNFNGGWIPTERELPEERKPVLVQMCDGEMEIACYWKKHGGRWCLNDNGGIYWVDLGEVAAWQTLPEPWKGDEDAD